MTSQWRHHQFDFYEIWPQSDIPNFILILHKRAEIQRRRVNRELWSKKRLLRHCDLDLLPKVTNFSRVWASVVSYCLTKTVSKQVHPFGWNFVHKQSRTYTHTLYFDCPSYIVHVVTENKCQKEAFRERKHLHFCELWPWHVTLTLLQGQYSLWN